MTSHPLVGPSSENYPPPDPQRAPVQPVTMGQPGRTTQMELSGGNAGTVTVGSAGGYCKSTAHVALSLAWC